MKGYLLLLLLAAGPFLIAMAVIAPIVFFAVKLSNKSRAKYCVKTTGKVVMAGVKRTNDFIKICSMEYTCNGTTYSRPITVNPDYYRRNMGRRFNIRVNPDNPKLYRIDDMIEETKDW